MNPKHTWTLVGLAAALFAFIYFYERHLTDPPPVSTKVLTDFKAANVTSIQILPAGIRADFTNGAWQLTEPIVYPARSGAIEELLQALEGLSYQLHLSAQDLHNIKDYGLDAPSLTILLQAGTELPRVLKLGNRTPPGDQIYAQLVAREGVDVVPTDMLKFIPRRANDWRDTTFADLKAPFDHLAVTNGDKTLELQRDSATGPWHMTRPMQARADNSKIEELLFYLQKVRVSRFETDDAKADFESFGLQPPRWQLTLGQGTNTLTTFQFGKSPTNDDTQVYARVAGQNTVVQVPRDRLDSWCDDYEKFRDPHLAGLASGALDVIEVSGLENFKLERVTNDFWVITTAKSRKLPADSGLMRRFIEDLAKMQVVPINGQFAKDAVNEPDLPGYGLAAPARKFVLKRDPKDATPLSTNLLVVAELQFGAEKDGKVFARRPEEKSVYAVEAADFHKLPSQSLDLLERRLWNFSENDVRRLIVRLNGKTEKLGHTGTNRWVLESGAQGMIKEFEIEAGAQELGSLAVARWVDCPTTNRAQYGFSDKSLQITAELDGADKPQRLTLDVGGSSPDKRRYGSVQNGSESWIFEIPDDQLQRIIAYLGIHENGP